MKEGAADRRHLPLPGRWSLVLVEPSAEEETILRLWRSTWPEEQLFWQNMRRPSRCPWDGTSFHQRIPA